MTTTWNPSDDSGVTLSGSNTIATANNGANGGARGTTSHSTGKWYIEYVIHHPTQNNVNPGLSASGGGFEGTSNSTLIATLAVSGATISTPAGGFSPGFSALADGDVVSVAVDLTGNLIWFRVNGGNWNGSGTANPATGTGGFSTANGSGGFNGGSPGIFPYITSQGGFSPPNAGATVVPLTFSFTVPTGFAGWDATPPVTGTWASTEATDTFVGGGFPGFFFGVVGDLLSTEAPDAFNAAGYQPVSAIMISVENADVFAALGHQPLTGTFNTTEAADIFAAIGLGRGEAGVFITTEHADIFAAIGHTPIASVFITTEAADRFLALGAGVTRVRRRRSIFVT
jgi:hypothetical protein